MDFQLGTRLGEKKRRGERKERRRADKRGRRKGIARGFPLYLDDHLVSGCGERLARETNTQVTSVTTNIYKGDFQRDWHIQKIDHGSHPAQWSAASPFPMPLSWIFQLVSPPPSMQCLCTSLRLLYYIHYIIIAMDDEQGFPELAVGGAS